MPAFGYLFVVIPAFVVAACVTSFFFIPPRWLAWIIGGIFFCIAAFCGYGTLASLEPGGEQSLVSTGSSAVLTPSGAGHLWYFIGYAAIGVLCVVATGRLIRIALGR